MATSHFEKLIDDEKRRTADAMLSIPNGDSHRHAELKGIHQGLAKAAALYREAARIDIDKDDV